MQVYISHLGRFLLRHQYQLLALVLLYKVIVDATYGALFGDFWEHSAVVHELLRNPFRPDHPLLPIDAPHVFISPYAYLVAGAAALFHLTSVNALILFGILNFCLFIHALKFLIASILSVNDDRLTNQTAFVALLLILFLWGIAPWGYSGFFYFDNLSLVLPYPSTFTVILSFYAMALGFRLKPSGDVFALGAIFCICVFVLLSHPLTFISLALCLVAQSLSSKAFFFADQSFSASGPRNFCRHALAILSFGIARIGRWGCVSSFKQRHVQQCYCTHVAGTDHATVSCGYVKSKKLQSYFYDHCGLSSNLCLWILYKKILLRPCDRNHPTVSANTHRNWIYARSKTDASALALSPILCADRHDAGRGSNHIDLVPSYFYKKPHRCQ